MWAGQTPVAAFVRQWLKLKQCGVASAATLPSWTSPSRELAACLAVPLTFPGCQRDNIWKLL